VTVPVWLIVAALISLWSADAKPMRVSAAICRNRTCTERAIVGFEPARVDVQVYVPLDGRNRRLTYGLACEDGVVAQSATQLNGTSDPPLFVQTYRDVGAGECQAMAVVDRIDGSRQTGRSITLVIRSRFGGNE
jgi:hypothetical protein